MTSPRRMLARCQHLRLPGITRAATASFVLLLLVLLLMVHHHHRPDRGASWPLPRRAEAPSHPHFAGTTGTPTFALGSSPLPARTQIAAQQHRHPPHQQLSLPAATVCIVGNAETTARARAVHAMWHAAFPAVFYVWKEAAAPADAALPTSLHTIYAPPGLAFTEGLELGLAAAAARYACEYYFLHDDDLVFVPAPALAGAIEQLLLDALQRHRPAVAGFAWEVGRRRMPAMHRVAAAYAGQEVAPLTGFDNGMVLLHRSVLGLFVPFHPRGEGGFVGKWTLGAHYLRLFVPFTFTSAAVVLQTLAYRNTINLDNVSRREKHKIDWQTDTLVKHRASRHAYEYPSNTAYLAFLRQGLKCFDCPFGMDLEPEDMAWRPQPGRLPYTQLAIAKQINTFFDLRHPALSNVPFLEGGAAAGGKQRSAPDGTGCKAAALADTRLVLAIKCFLGGAEASADSSAVLSRLLRTLAAAMVSSERLSVRLDIHHSLRTPQAAAALADTARRARAQSGGLQRLPIRLLPVGDPGRSVRPLFSAPAQALPSADNRTVLNVGGEEESARASAAARVVASWAPTHSDEYVLLLNASAQLSPQALAYTERMVRELFYHADAPPFHATRLAGLALCDAELQTVGTHTGGTVQHLHRGVPPGAPYRWVMPNTCAAVYSASAWRHMARWLAEEGGQGGDEPGQMLLAWDRAARRFFAAHNYTLVYPNVEGEARLADCQGRAADAPAPIYSSIYSRGDGGQWLGASMEMRSPAFERLH